MIIHWFATSFYGAAQSCLFPCSWIYHYQLFLLALIASMLVCNLVKNSRSNLQSHPLPLMVVVLARRNVMHNKFMQWLCLHFFSFFFPIWCDASTPYASFFYTSKTSSSWWQLTCGKMLTASRQHKVKVLKWEVSVKGNNLLVPTGLLCSIYKQTFFAVICCLQHCWQLLCQSSTVKYFINDCHKLPHWER